MGQTFKVSGPIICLLGSPILDGPKPFGKSSTWRRKAKSFRVPVRLLHFRTQGSFKPFVCWKLRIGRGNLNEFEFCESAEECSDWGPRGLQSWGRWQCLTWRGKLWIHGLLFRTRFIRPRCSRYMLILLVVEFSLMKAFGLGFRV